MINSILCTQDTITSAKVHTSTSQIYLIQCHPLYSLLQPLMPIFYSLNTHAHYHSKAFLDFWFHLPIFSAPGSLYGQPFFTFQVSFSISHLREGILCPSMQTRPLNPVIPYPKQPLYSFNIN